MLTQVTIQRKLYSANFITLVALYERLNKMHDIFLIYMNYPTEVELFTRKQQRCFLADFDKIELNWMLQVNYHFNCLLSLMIKHQKIMGFFLYIVYLVPILTIKPYFQCNATSPYKDRFNIHATLFVCFVCCH